MKKSVCLILCLVCIVALNGQVPGDEDERYGFLEDDFTEIESDGSLFFLELGDGTDIFSRMSRYNFNFTTYRHRGYTENMGRKYLGRLDVSPVNEKYPDYTFYSALRESYAAGEETANGNLPAYGVNSIGGSEEFYILPSQRRQGHSLTANYSERRYRTAIKVVSAANLGKGWSYAFSTRRKWGRDAFVDGVFTDALTVSLGVEKLFKDNSRFGLFAIGAPYEQSTKAWVVPEVVEMTGNKMYNPNWGYFDGAQRSSRVNSGFTPMIAASYDFAPLAGHEMNLSAGWRTGERRRSGFSWYDAANPTPDYYMNLPSHITDQELSDEVEAAWRKSDPHYTQVDWERMWLTNVLSDNAVYVLEDRAEKLNHLQLAFTGRTSQDKSLRMNYGVRLKHNLTNYHKRVKDLLGAKGLVDTDQYYEKNELVDGNYLNDLRNPDRVVGEGEKFGYDYNMTRMEGTAFGALDYRDERWQLRAGAELMFSSMQREGFYERERFPAAASIGKSDRYNFTSYNLKLAARYAASPRHHISLLAYAGETEPLMENFFLSPEACNFTLGNAENRRILGAELRYNGTLFPFLDFELAGYWTATSRETEIYRYYDDLHFESSVMSLTGVSKRNAGVELGLKADITTRLKLAVAGAVNSYVYTNDPTMEILSDFDLRPTLTDGAAYLKGLIPSASPQLLATTSLTYSTPSGFRAELSYSYADRRYVSINPLRRTNRVIALGATPEARDEFVRQERLPAATSVNFYISQRFRIKGTTLFASISVNNLLDKTDIYGGYEQMRVRRRGDYYIPSASKYSYGYPRTIYGTLSFSF